MTKPSEKWTYMGAAPCRLNGVPFTNDMANVFKWMGPGGSDCGSESAPGCLNTPKVKSR